MTSRTKQKCEWLVDHLKKQGYSLQVPLREVKYAIAENIGGDDRTINKYLKRLVEFGLLKMKNQAVMEFCGVRAALPKNRSLERFLVVEDEDEPP